jgi:hypothetical protein
LTVLERRTARKGTRDVLFEEDSSSLFVIGKGGGDEDVVVDESVDDRVVDGALLRVVESIKGGEKQRIFKSQP